MAKLALRPYLIEISDMVDQGHLDEAIAHCRHILERFPKHIETYRVLGKAYLETQQFGDATDILQRVLSSIPGDFVANIGLSIIREDEGNIDASIWHMERAFESQPAHQGVQEELRRLYGQRDGIEPKKIRMTRGALATMYATGDLYDQAIAELLAALKDDINRPDLQVLLAKMYFESSKFEQAIKISNKILEKLPNNLTATKILVETSDINKDDNSLSESRDRWIELDPYVKYLSENEFNPNRIPDSQVVLQRLDFYSDNYSIAPDSSTSSLDKVGSLGKTDEETAIPDWMESAREMSDESDFSSIQDDADNFDDDISDENFEDSPPNTEEWLQPSPEDDPLLSENEEIPEWLSEESEIDSLSDIAQISESESKISQEDDGSTALPESDETNTNDEIPDWVQSLQTDENTEEKIAADKDFQMPKGVEMDNDWLRNDNDDENAEKFNDKGNEESQEGDSITSPIDDADDTGISWLEDLAVKQDDDDEESISSPEAKIEESSEWVASLEESPTENHEGDLPLDEPKKEAVLEKEDTQGNEPEGNWLSKLESLSEESDSKPIEDVPDWLASLTEDSEPIIIQEEDTSPSEEIPDWLSDVTDISEEIPVEDDQINESDVVQELIQEGNEEIGASVPIEEELSEGEERTPAWMGDLMNEDVDPNSEISQRIEEDSTSIPPAEAPNELGENEINEDPDWLSELSSEHPIQELSEEQLSEESSLDDNWLSDLVDKPPVESMIDDPEPTEENQSAQSDDDTPDWLAGLTDPKESPLDSSISNIDNSEEGMGWLDELLNEPEEETVDFNIKPDSETPLPEIKAAAEGETETMDVFGPPSTKSESVEASQMQEEISDTSLPEWLNPDAEKPSKSPDWMPAQIEDEISEDLPDSSPDQPQEELLSVNPPAVPDWIIKDPVIMNISSDEINEKFSRVNDSPLESDSEADLPQPDPKEYFIAADEKENIPIGIQKDNIPKAQSASDRLLQEAQDLLKGNNLDDALKMYSKLIRKGKNLDTILTDINRSLKKHPLNVELWKILGDTYLREDKLQEAMDSYTKAENLLR